eukprot:394659_1
MDVIYDTNEKVTAWANRVVTVICLALCLYLLYRELNNRKQHKEQTVHTNVNPYQKLLNIWSMLVIILAVITSVFSLMYYTPIIACIYGAWIGSISLLNTRVILTFYQISRLQYCFLNKQIHSQYGYSKYVFYILYTFGICISLYASICVPFIIDYKVNKYQCYGNSTNFYFTWLYTAFPLYYIWDWLVLGLYVNKIIQIRAKKKRNDNKNNNIIIKRVNITLNKILLLTIFYEIATAIGTGVYSIWEDNNILSIILRSTFRFDPLITSVLIYLMIESNNEEYLKILLLLYKSKICFCCAKYMKDSVNSMNDKENIELQVQNTDCIKDSMIDTINETHSIGATKESVPMRHTMYIDQSEATLTNQV